MKNGSFDLKVRVLVAQSCPILCDLHGLAHQNPWDSPGKTNGVGSCFLLQGGLTWHMNKTGISVNGYLELKIVQIVDPFNFVEKRHLKSILKQHLVSLHSVLVFAWPALTNRVSSVCWSLLCILCSPCGNLL